jgi:hypothetical protein
MNILGILVILIILFFTVSAIYVCWQGDQVMISLLKKFNEEDKLNDNY